MLAAKTREPAKAKTDSPPDKATPGKDVAPQVQINTLWHSLATHVARGTNLGALGEPPPIQTQLNVGTPDDQHEREADRVAQTVMRMPELWEDGELTAQAKLLVPRPAPYLVSVQKRQRFDRIRDSGKKGIEISCGL